MGDALLVLLGRQQAELAPLLDDALVAPEPREDGGVEPAPALGDGPPKGVIDRRLGE